MKPYLAEPQALGRLNRQAVKLYRTNWGEERAGGHQEHVGCTLSGKCWSLQCHWLSPLKDTRRGYTYRQKSSTSRCRGRFSLKFYSSRNKWLLTSVWTTEQLLTSVWITDQLLTSVWITDQLLTSIWITEQLLTSCLLYTSPSPRDA